MTTVEDLIAASMRMRNLSKEAQGYIVQFATNNSHIEGDSWFGIIESCLAEAYINFGEVIDALKDCRFALALPYAKLAGAMIYNCRYIAEFTTRHRALYIPDDYLGFMRETNETLSQVGGYANLLIAQIEEKNV